MAKSMDESFGFWESVEAATKEVQQWPDWKKVGWDLIEPTNLMASESAASKTPDTDERESD